MHLKPQMPKENNDNDDEGDSYVYCTLTICQALF